MTIESDLISHPRFGDSSDIRRRAGLYYERGLELVAECHESAAKAVAGVAAGSTGKSDDLAGPVIRTAINNGLLGIKEGRAGLGDRDRAAFLAAAEHQGGVAGSETLVSSTPIRPTAEECAGLTIWDPSGERGPMDSYFQALFDQEIAGSVSSGKVELRQPTPRILEQLERGEELLTKLVPDLWRSVSGHVRLIAILDTSDRTQWSKPTRSDVCQNVSTHAIPSTVFLSPSPLRTAWHAAEALLHEAAHKKLSDIVLTRSVFKDGFDSEKAETIRALWNPHLSWNSADWSTDRALFAFHVYIHLALFFELAEREDVDRYGFGAPPPSFRGEREKALDRATYLGTKLQFGDDGDLGPDGRELVAWLSDVLAMFKHEDYVAVARRLLLDCYDRETQELEARLNAVARAGGAEASETADDLPDTGVARVVDHLVHSEIVAGYRALTVLGEAEEASFAHYDGDRWMCEAQSRSSLMASATALCGLRRFMSATLRAASPAAFSRMYRTRRTKTLLDHLEEMVLHYSRHSEKLQRELAGSD